VTLAAFFVQTRPGAPALHIGILDAHFDAGPDAREGIDHNPDQRPIAQARRGLRINGIDQHPGLNGCEHRRLAFFNDMLWPPDRAGRVDRHHLPHDQPVEQHPDRCEL